MTSLISLNRGVGTALSILLISATMFGSSGNTQASTPAAHNAVGWLQGTPPAADNVPDAFSYNVYPKTKTFMAAFVEYNTSTCAEISPGSWSVTTAPTLGGNSFGTVTGMLGNGDCPGMTFTFAAIYYKWTSAVSTTPNDSFAATWTSPDFTIPNTFAITLIIPNNYMQTASSDKPNGVLHFEYSWTSTSGALADLTQCQVGENVAYPGGNPYVWPNPPFNGSTQNPTVIFLAATDGALQDNHSHTPFVMPYTAAAFNATQQYQYRCRNLDTTDFTGFNNVIIARSVSDTTGKGCWTYMITKSGASNTQRLPGVTHANCTADTDAEDGEAVREAKNGADELGLSVAHDVTVSLHEPVRLDLTVFNRTARTVTADLGLNKQSNLELTIEEPSGGVVVRRLSSDGFGGVGRISLKPGAKFVKPLLLNEWNDFTATGDYHITVALLPAERTTNDEGTGERPRTGFTVHVTPRNPARLQRVAEELAAQAIGGKTMATSMDAAKALSYMRDPQVVSSLVRVLQQGSLVEHYAVDGLARIGTPEAVAALMAEQDNPSEEVRAAVRTALENLQQPTREHSGPKD
jgi:hypothetical protein